MHLRLALRLYFVILAYLIVQVSPAAAQIASAAAAPNNSYNFGDVLARSAIGGQVPAFTPLSIWNFTDGWLEPWIPPPNGELHLQRGGWVNTASGFFSRELDPTFSFNAGTDRTRDEYIGAVSLFVPLNRRLQIGVTMPFIDSLQRGSGLPTENSFGDVVVAPQLMLEETETRSVSAIVAIRTPTGQTSTGNGKTIVTPTLAVWQDLPDAWQVRGGMGVDVATHAGEGPHEVLNFNLAAGNTLTRHETLPFGDLTPYLSANVNQDLGSGKNFTDFSLTPGVRFFVGWHTYFIAGVIVPVTNPKPFEPGLSAVVSRGW